MRHLPKTVSVKIFAVGAVAAALIARADEPNTTATTNAAPAAPSEVNTPPAATMSAGASASLQAPANPMPSRMPAEHGGFGVGAILGEPTGFTMKYWLSGHAAVDAAAAWSFEDRDSFHLHGDYLFHKFDLFPVDRGELPLYFGVGGRVKFVEHGDTRAGVRLPVGVAYLFADAPLEIFAEVAPIIDVTPATQLRFNGGVGVRYYFR